MRRAATLLENQPVREFQSDCLNFSLTVYSFIFSSEIFLEGGQDWFILKKMKVRTLVQLILRRQ